MLRELSIRNFAIIDDIRIQFDGGLTILSGETGAGKSIIINAVNLLLGSRASAEFIRTGASSAELEAQFDIPADSPAGGVLAENDLEPDLLLIRRVITENNRHRVYINNRLSTSTLLNAVTENLAAISGQHAHQGLLDEDRHLLILDQYGGLTHLREEVRIAYRAALPLIREVERLEAAKLRKKEQTELLEFQRNEILAARIEPGEDATLETELKRLKNGEQLYQAAHSGIDVLYAEDNAVVERFDSIVRELEKAGHIDPTLTPIVDKLNDVRYRMEDAVEGLRTYLSEIQIDPVRLEAADDRLDALRKLKRKYGGSLEAVAEHLKAVEVELKDVFDIDDRIEAARKERDQQRVRLSELSADLSEKRRTAAEKLSRKVEAELSSLGMEGTRFTVAVEGLPPGGDTSGSLNFNGMMLTETGMDRAAFLIAPNVGESRKPLRNIASGGELSRVVLSLMVILAETESVGTIVFDEVDAGIGGGVAEIVGEKIAALSEFHQVICITHLPQIARFGKHHFRISKHVEDGRTKTAITPLSEEKRVEEIARMLGGVRMTRTALEHAREMLGGKEYRAHKIRTRSKI